MGTASVSGCLVVLFLLCNTTHGWDNDWDGGLLMECPSGQALYAVKSQHNNHYEDRLWEFRCHHVSGLGARDRCEWHNNVNGYDGQLNFQCPDGLITGVKSHHHNHYEDRVWSYRCCKPGGSHICHLSHTAQTGYINNMDGWMDWSTYQTIYGFYSYHSNHYEDRQWKVYYGDLECVDQCSCSGTYGSDWEISKVDFPDLTQYESTDAPPDTVAQENLDNPSRSAEIQIRFEVSETTTDTSTFSSSVGTSISVQREFTVTVPVINIGASTSLTLGASYDHTWGETKSIAKRVGATFVVTVPPMTHVIAKATMTKLMIDKLPVTYTMRHITLGCECHVGGFWDGLVAHNLQLSVEDRDGNPMDVLWEQVG